MLCCITEGLGNDHGCWVTNQHNVTQAKAEQIHGQLIIAILVALLHQHQRMEQRNEVDMPALHDDALPSIP